MGGVDRGQGGVGVGDLFDRQELGLGVESEAAVGLGHRNAHGVELPETAQQIGREIPSPVALGSTRHHLVVGELPDDLVHLFLHVVEGVWHSEPLRSLSLGPRVPL